MENLNLTLYLGAAAAVTALLCWIAYLHASLSSLRRRYGQMMGDMSGKTLEELFLARLNDIAAAKDNIAFLDRRCQELEKNLSGCVQNIGVVRFNAFDNTGGDLSYAVSFLDRHGDGVVLSGIYGRNEARCYAKPVAGGQSSYLLTSEERQAIGKNNWKK